LQKHADEFRFSLDTLLTRKGALINRFINTLVQEVRSNYQQMNDHIVQWIQEALMPLLHNNQYQKQLLETHMLRLTQMQGQRNTQSEQIETLQTNIYQLQAALNSLEPLYQEIINAPLAERETKNNIEKMNRGQVVSLTEARQAVRGVQL
jgi:hypothetical protein